MITAALLGAFSALTIGPIAGREISPLLEVGKPLPDLVLPTPEGRLEPLHRFKGRKTILHVFASW